MQKRLAMMCLLATMVVGIACSPVQAQVNSSQAETLKGIDAVFVIVEDLPPGAAILNLTKETIQTDVELRLRLAGMRVVTEEQGFALPGAPYLYININLTNDGGAASIDVELHQNAFLERNRSFDVGVVTWSKGSLLQNPTAQFVRDYLKEDVDGFLNAWLSVNPKK